jgi:glycosyltransferase involved in cell wall biosynthesis
LFKEGDFKKFKIWNWLLANNNLIENADVVHCHDVFFWYFPFRILYPNKPVFTTFHGYESYPLKYKNILIRKLSEKLSNGNICIGDFIKKWYGTKPTFISYGGVDIEDESKFKVKNNNSAVFIGRLDEQTGILTYVKAVEIFRKKIKKFDFLVIGDGDLKTKINGKVNLLKALPNATKYIKKYNFAFVSRYLSILEAMAARRMVFAVYDNPIKEDYLRMAPFSKYISISGSSLELSTEIVFYLNNLKKKEQLIQKGYSWVKKHSWESVTKTYLKLWE